MDIPEKWGVIRYEEKYYIVKGWFFSNALANERVRGKLDRVVVVKDEQDTPRIFVDEEEIEAFFLEKKAGKS